MYNLHFFLPVFSLCYLQSLSSQVVTDLVLSISGRVSILKFVVGVPAAGLLGVWVVGTFPLILFSFGLIGEKLLLFSFLAPFSLAVLNSWFVILMMKSYLNFLYSAFYIYNELMFLFYQKRHCMLLNWQRGETYTG